MLTEDSNLFSIKQHREPLSQTGWLLFVFTQSFVQAIIPSMYWGWGGQGEPRVNHDVLLPLSTQGVRINTQRKGVMVRTDKLTKHGG